MKKGAVLVTLAIFLTGCGAASNYLKHAQSAITGLHRKITLYSSDGHTIKSWTVTAQVEYHGSVVSFVTDEKRAVAVGGTVLVEEL